MAQHQPSLADDTLIDAEDRVPSPLPGGPALVWLGTCIVLVAFNLRPLFSSLSSLLPEVMAGTGLQAGGASALTILPVLCLGLFAPLAPVLAGRIGTERALLGALLLVALGTAVRGLGTVAALLGGSALAGAGIAVGNVLLPGLVKRDFGARAAAMTGFYTMALCGGAAAAAGLTVPLSHALDGHWAWALALWAVPAVGAALIWAPRARHVAPAARRAGPAGPVLWRSGLAWQVTFFMGLQSALSYSVFGWLAPILRSRGLDGVTAGLVVSVSVMFQVAASLLVPPFAVRRDQRWVGVALTAAALVPLLGFLFGSLAAPWVWIWAALQGIGQGGLFALALTVIVLRSRDAHMAARLSAMSQGVGYVLASGGPLLVGLVHDWTGGFAASAWVLCGLSAGIALSVIGAGRNLRIGGGPEPG